MEQKTTMATHDKEYKISSEKSLKQQKQQILQKKRNLMFTVHYLNVQLSTKIYEACKEKGMYGPQTGGNNSQKLSEEVRC